MILARMAQSQMFALASKYGITQLSSFSIKLVKNRVFIFEIQKLATPLAFKLPTKGFPSDVSRKIFSWMSMDGHWRNMANGEEKLPKILTG